MLAVIVTFSPGTAVLTEISVTYRTDLITVNLIPLEFPAASVDVIVIILKPGFSITVELNLPPITGTTISFIVTSALSSVVPLTTVSFSVVTELFNGVRTNREGGVLSTTNKSKKEPEFPDKSSISILTGYFPSKNGEIITPV